MHQAMQVQKPDVFTPDAQFQQHVEAGDASRAAAGRDDLDVGKAFAGDMHRIRGGRADDDGCAVLVVVKDRDIHTLAAEFFDDEAVRCLDVFKVHRAKGRFQRANDIGQLFGIGFVNLDVETVDIGEFLEQNRLAFHDRLRGLRANIAKAKHRRAVGHHRNQVRPRGVAACVLGVFLDLKTGFGNARRIGERQVPAIGQRLGRADFQFAWFWMLVIVQSRLAKAVLALVIHVCSSSAANIV